MNIPFLPTASIFSFLCVVAAVSSTALPATAAAPAEGVVNFTDKYCASCHNDVDKEAGLDLSTMEFAPADAGNLLSWVRIYDRVQRGEMPPKEKKRPPTGEMAEFLREVGQAVTGYEQTIAAEHGRAQRRRMNRSEFENTLRDLLEIPTLRVADLLPEDGEAAHFNKVSKALDVSHVHVARYMSAAQLAVREAMAAEWLKRPTKTVRYWARENHAYTATDGVPDRGRFPILGSGPDLRALSRQGPLTVGDSDPATREIEAMAWSHSDFGTAFTTNWSRFRAPVSGKYNLRFSAYTVWMGSGGSLELRRGPGNGGQGAPQNGAGQAAAATPAAGGRGGNAGPGGPPQLGPPEWYLSNHRDITPGRRDEPLHVYARVPPSAGQKIGTFDLTPEPQIFELKNVALQADQYIITDAARLYRSRPGLTAVVNYTNPLAQPDGQPGVAFRWMEVEGPLYDGPALAGYQLLFGDLKMRRVEGEQNVGVKLQLPSPPDADGTYGRFTGLVGVHQVRPKGTVAVEVVSADPQGDAERLLRNFIARAYRHPVRESDVQRFLNLFKQRHDRGIGFAAAMMTMYTAVLSSEQFVYLDEGQHGPLDEFALATRLALFLTNGGPDAELRALAARGELHRPEILRQQTQRLLESPKSARFVQAFLDYWLELRKVFDTTPDMNLYGDYFLEDALVEAGVEETQLFFTELLKQNLPARYLIDSDFTFLNERLATHYGVPDVDGVKLRRVALPANSVRGGIMTQASVLKLTANGTTTSPVLRGKWIMERVVGYEIPLPPASVPAVEPDVRGATTIRAQLDKHRADESCAGCHRNIDPPGFALESFDVLGGWRDRYRAIAKGQEPDVGFGKNGWPKTYYFALPVDPSGSTVDGRAFNDVRDFKKILLQDQEQIARNLARQMVVYATGAPIRFSDRAAVEQILQQTRATNFGVRSMLDAIVQSPLFQNK